MRKSSLFALATLSALFALGSAGAQDIPAATRGDLEVGGTLSLAKPDLPGAILFTNPVRYTNDSFIYGGSIYANFNVTGSLGLTAQFDYPDVHTPNDLVERSYLIGLRYYHPVGEHFAPYVKALAGIGSTKFSNSVVWVVYPGTPTDGTTSNYTTVAFGGGLDYRWKPKWTIRAIDLQYEDWLGFPGGSIHPYIVSIGIAYHVR
jgi:hypothetical protein